MAATGASQPPSGRIEENGVGANLDKMTLFIIRGISL
jgi:hypothetical protein